MNKKIKYGPRKPNISTLDNLGSSLNNSGNKRNTTPNFIKTNAKNAKPNLSGTKPKTYLSALTVIKVAAPKNK